MPFGIRARTIAAASAGLAMALLGSGVALVVLTRQAQLSSIDHTLAFESSSVIALANRGQLGSVVAPVGGDNLFVQVFDHAGRIVAASAGLEGQGRVVTAHFTGLRTLNGLSIGSNDAFRVLVAPLGRGYVVVGESLGAVERSVADLERALLVIDPLVVILAGALVGLLARRALAPVEALRQRVAVISRQSLHERLPEPDSDDEIGRLARTMNEMLERLESADARQRRFIADASHELKSPLAAASADLEIALSHAGDAQWATVASAVIGDLERVRRIVEDQLVLARLDEGVAVAFEEVDVDEIVLEAAARARSLSGVRIDVSGVGAARVRGDREALSRVVRNLLDNALSHAESVVTLRLEVSGSDVRLGVGDDGAGIDPADREVIFERYRRLDSSRGRDEGGSGLGLAIVADIVRAHGGSVSVADHGPGAHLEVLLPAMDEEPAAS